MSVKGWFPTYIYYDDLKKGKAGAFNTTLLDECYRIREIDKKGKQWCEKHYPGGYTSYGSISNLHQRSHNFIELEKFIRKHVLRFAQTLDMDLKGRRIFMMDLWLNIMPKRVMHSMHIHPLSFISGTYYVKTPAGCSSIKFEDPRMARFMAAPPKKKGANILNKPYVEYPAKAGKLVLFESWLPHEVSSNPTKDDRVSVSFNYGWE